MPGLQYRLALVAANSRGLSKRSPGTGIGLHTLDQVVVVLGVLLYRQGLIPAWANLLDLLRTNNDKTSRK